MGKIVLLSIVLILAGFLSSAAQNNFMVQERLQRQNANFESSKFLTPKKNNSGPDWWEPDTVYCFITTGYIDRFIFKYNSHGLLEEDTHQYWGNNSWGNDRSNTYTYTYDSNNNVFTKATGNNSLSTYTYDSDNNMLTDLSQNRIDNAWVNSTLRTYTYDSNNNRLTDLFQKWVNNSWENALLFTYTYDSNNNRLTELPQKWQNDSWVNDWFNAHTYTYDSNNNLLTKLDELNYLSTYTYDSNNNVLNKLIQDRSDNSWSNMGLITYACDFDNNTVTELWQRWINNSWVNTYQYLRTYDENGNGTSVEFRICLEEGWQPANNLVSGLKLYYNNMQSYFFGGDYKMTASYVKVSDINTAIPKPVAPSELNISIYPNPTTGELRIENCESRIKDIKIFDAIGNKLPLCREKAEGKIDISHLPAGIYFVQITTEKGVVTKKIMKR